jgi:uncharacterized Zn finger protein
MNGIPPLTDRQIRNRTSENSWARGRSYVDRVHDVVWRDGELTAQVDGSDWAPYRVHITFLDQEILDAQCSCPYDWGGDCKHIVAVLLCMRDREDILIRPSLTDLLADLPREALVELLLDLTARHPELVDEVDARSLRAGKGYAAANPATTGLAEKAPRYTLDATILRRQIVTDMRSAIRDGYDSWGEEAWYDSDLEAALDPALKQARTLIAQGAVEHALDLLQATTEAWTEGADALDEYVYEYFMDLADEFTVELSECWTEALLRADFNEAARAQWTAYLDDQVEEAFGGGSLAMALTAVEQGWDYPPLVAAMSGNISDMGAWDEDAPLYADRLAKIRLAILDERGDHAAYLNLAQAEGQLLAYLQMLVRRQQSDLAVAEAMEYLDSPSDIHALAQTLFDSGQPKHALALAQQGLSLTDDGGKGALAVWLRDAAAARSDQTLALDAARYAFALDLRLANYRAIRRIAKQEWPQFQPELLRIVRQNADTHAAVEIFLDEGLHADAIAAVDDADWFYDLGPVIDAVGATHPDWAFGACCKQAEAIISAKLARARDVLVAAGKQTKWDAYFEALVAQHVRKYKLMRELRAMR